MAYYNCILFDADGTLLDFETAQRNAIRQTMADLNQPDNDAVVEAYCAINAQLWLALEKGEIRKEKIFKERFIRLSKQLHLDFDAAKANELYEINLGNNAQLIPGAYEVLKELSEVATIAIITNGTAEVQKNRLKQSGIGPLVDACFISDVLGSNKPSDKFFQAALNDLGVENRSKVLVVGDSIKADIEGGRNSGLATCWVNYNDETLANPAADYTIHSLEQLYSVVMEPEEKELIGCSGRKHMFET